MTSAAWIESFRKRRDLLVLSALLLSISFICLDAWWRVVEIKTATNFQLPNTSNTVTFRGNESPRRSVLLLDNDTKWWVIHSEEMSRLQDWRVRHTDFDNSPIGREVHWSSSIMWGLSAMAHGLKLLNNTNSSDLFAWAAVYFGPLSLICILHFTYRWVLKRMGCVACIVYMLSLVTAYPLAQFFRAGVADHHGLVSICCLFSVFFLAVGLERQSYSFAKAKKDFVIAGIFGATGLWISASTQIPVLLGSAAGVILGRLIFRKSPDCAVDPRVWSVWGITGGLASIGFYLLEYFPNHMGWRLEVNHPIYALAWICGGEWLRRATELIQSETERERIGAAALRLLMLTIGILSPALLIFLFKERIFWVADSFVFNLHKYYISEFLSLFEFARQTGGPLWCRFVDLAWCIFALLISGCVLFSKNVHSIQKSQLILCLIPACLLQVEALLQVRWHGPATALWICVFVVLARILSEAMRASRFVIRGVAAGLIFTTLLAAFPHDSLLSFKQRIGNPTSVNESYMPSIVARDVSQVIQRTSTYTENTILAGPNTTTDFCFYGRMKGLGTLYWENKPGLEAAADIYAAKTDSAALALLTQHQITHMVFFGWDSFAQRYVRLARNLGRDTDVRDGFIAGILEGTRPQPLWLRPIYYPLTPENGKAHDDLWARIYEVVPDQTPTQWYYHVGIYQIGLGKLNLAAESFRKALLESQLNVEASVALAAILFNQQKNTEARQVIHASLESAGDAEAFRSALQAMIRREQWNDAMDVCHELLAYYQTSKNAPAAEDILSTLKRFAPANHQGTEGAADR